MEPNLFRPERLKRRPIRALTGIICLGRKPNRIAVLPIPEEKVYHGRVFVLDRSVSSHVDSIQDRSDRRQGIPPKIYFFYM